MDITPVSPYATAEAYRIGQIDGFKAGLAAGVVAVVLVRSMRRKHQKPGRYWIWSKHEDKKN